MSDSGIEADGINDRTDGVCIASVYRAVLIDFIAGTLEVFDTLNCYGCDVDHPSQTHHPCILGTTTFDPIQWSKLLSFIDRRNVVKTVNESLKRLNFENDFTYASENPSLYDATLLHIMEYVGYIACQCGELDRELIFKAFKFMRKLIERSVLAATRRCYDDEIKYNERLYDMRIITLENAVKRDKKIIDVKSINNYVKRIEAGDTFGRLMKNLKEDFDDIQDMEHVKALRERYRRISPALQKAEWVVDLRPKSIVSFMI